MKLVDFAIRQAIYDQDWRGAAAIFAESLGDKEMLNMLAALDDGSYIVSHLSVGPLEMQIHYRAIITFWQSGMTGFAPYHLTYKKPSVRLYVPCHSAQQL